MKTAARLSAEDRSDLFRNTANRIVFVKLKGKNDMWHDNDQEYEEWFDSQDKVIISKVNIPDEIWYEKYKTKELVKVWPEHS